MEVKTIWSNMYGWIGIHKPANKSRTVLVIGKHGCSGEPIAQFLDGGGMTGDAKAKWFAKHIVRMLDNEPK